MGAVLGGLYICIILSGYLLLIVMMLGVLFAVLRTVFLGIQRLCAFFYRKYRSKKNQEPTLHWFTLPDGRRRYLP